MRELCVLSVLCAGVSACARADLIENEEQLAAVRTQLAEKYHRVSLPLLWSFKTDPEDRGRQEGWFNVARPDGSWSKIRGNERWENQGFAGYDGVAWYLNHVRVPEGWDQMFLRFPAVDDAYTLYVNGREVCSDGDRFRPVWQWATCHEITDYVQPGREATIVLRVEDYLLQGGLTRGPVELLNFPGQIDITADWQFTPDYNNVGVTEGWYATWVDDSRWRRVDAGLNWEYYGYEFDGFGWYRKWITVPAAWADQRIFLELPKVDDYFDLYLDGRFIRHFGTPHSPCWDKITCVDITEHVVSGNRHLLCLRVEDVGQPGGLGGAPCTLSAQMPIYWLSRPADYGYLYANRPPGAPHIGPYPRETAIEGHSFRSQAPTLRAGENVTWSLVRGPAGLKIDPNTGQVSWEEPTVGPEAFLDWDLRWDHPILVKAENAFGCDYAGALLKVLDNQGPELQMIRTQYIDWVVTEEIAAWFAQAQPHIVIDRQWELLRGLIGQEPSYGRQSMKYQYNIDSTAWSGSPVIVGPGWWSTDPVDGWSLGVWLHEVGHNFNWQAPMRDYSSGPYDVMYHHLVEFLIQYVLHKSLQEPERFGFSAESLATFKEHVSRVRTYALEQYRSFQAWAANADDASAYPGDQYAAWKGLLVELIDEYGCECLARSIRAMRTDGVPRALRRSADTIEKRNALLFCILSHATGSDLREYFRQRKFRFDEAFYATIDRRIGVVLSQLPEEDVAGWKRNPGTGHYYRRTPFEMTWPEAEDYAQSVGGHLASIDSDAERNWLGSRFEIYQEVWVGTHRDADGTWRNSADGQPTTGPWEAGYPVPAPDHRYAVLDLIAGKLRNTNERERLFGIIEVENLPARDDPGFRVEY
jgi:hypothetical protein